MTERHKISVCGMFAPDGKGGGVCSIHGDHPSDCVNFFCEEARIRIANGEEPCRGCTISKMAEQGCCTNDLGLGTKNVSIKRVVEDCVDNHFLSEIADKLLQRSITPEQAEELLRANGF